MFIGLRKGSQFSSSLGRLGSGDGLGVRSLGSGGGSEVLLGFSVFGSSNEEGVGTYKIKLLRHSN